MYVDLLTNFWDAQGVINAAARSTGPFAPNQDRLNRNAALQASLHARLGVYAPTAVQNAARGVEALLGPALKALTTSDIGPSRDVGPKLDAALKDLQAAIDQDTHDVNARLYRMGYPWWSRAARRVLRRPRW